MTVGHPNTTLRVPVEDVKLGMKVGVTFEQASKDVWLPKFKPV